MRRFVLFSDSGDGVLCHPAAQQTGLRRRARQALLEIFFSKTPGTFVKHLPVTTRTALDKSGALASLQSIP